MQTKTIELNYERSSKILIMLNYEDFKGPFVIVHYDREVILYRDQDRNIAVHTNFDQLARKYSRPVQENEILVIVKNGVPECIYHPTNIPVRLTIE